MENCIKYHYRIIDQIEAIVHKLGNPAYTHNLSILSGSSIGQHIRHIVEFYVCLFSDKHYVNYDERERNLLIEQSPAYALSVIQEIKNQVEKLDKNQVIELMQNLNGEPVSIPSSYLRELIYLSEHTIHHFAIIKIGLDALSLSHLVDENFGVAESTIRYKESNPIPQCAS